MFKKKYVSVTSLQTFFLLPCDTVVNLIFFKKKKINYEWYVDWIIVPYNQ